MSMSLFCLLNFAFPVKGQGFEAGLGDSSSVLDGEAEATDVEIVVGKGESDV